MALAAGTRLGPYEITAPLGRGGMGEVYRAHDTRLARTVAVKVLPPELNTDTERRARFEREARAIAALNHPHICTLFDVGEAEVTLARPESRAASPESPAPSPLRVTYLVMEHLVGETLAQRLRKGPLPVPEALEVGAQMAEALDAAHKAGIVHRDLKPSNVMLTAGGLGRSGTGSVKLLDFGLAKLRPSVAPASLDDSMLTVTEPVTHAGEVLGTRPYMAPEQVEGNATDTRTDVWALGCVLYEMVTGQPAFEGANAARLASAILTEEPAPLTTVVPTVPPLLAHVVERCLAKAPEARWQSAADVASELQWLREGGPRAPRGRPTPRRGWRSATAGAATLVVLTAVATGWWLWTRRPPLAPAAVVRSQLDVRPADELNAGGMWPAYVVTAGGSRTALAWTPDGQALVFVGREGSGQRLYVRRLDAAEARPLANTEGAQMPAVSPDGQWVAFWADGAIRKVPIGGGPVTTLAANASISSRLSWDTEGGVFFDDGARRILRIPPDGPPAEVTRTGAGEVFHMLPHPLPRDGVLLFTVRRTHWSWGREEIVALNVATGERKTVLPDATDARFVPTGHLVFMRRGQLLAVAFDQEQLVAHGRPEVLLDGVAQSLTSGNLQDNVGAGQFAVAASGALAWLPGTVAPYPTGKLVAVDRHGRVTALPAPERSYVGAVRTSPDGRRLMVGIRSLTEIGLWALDLDRGALNPIVRDGEAMWSVWSPDGAAILFTMLKDGEWFVARQAVDGAATAQRLAKGEFSVSSVTSDGRHLAVTPTCPGDITVLTLDAESAVPQPFLQTGDLQSDPAFSPDGRWLAYTSNASGQEEVEVYVRPYPGPGPPRQVSVAGGWCSIWHPDGRALFYITGKELGATGSMMAVAFTPGTPPRIGMPKRLFDFDRRRLDLSTVPVRAFDISRDGQQFYTVEYGETGPAPAVTHINLVQHWFEELKAKVPVGR